MEELYRYGEKRSYEHFGIQVENAGCCSSLIGQEMVNDMAFIV
jgi:hypothetical protein